MPGINAAAIRYVSEEDVARHVGRVEVFDAVEAIFAAMNFGEARNFPVVREALDHKDALYGFKSGFDRRTGVLGVKAGGYWPHNASETGKMNHQSTVLLFDPDTGELRALVSGNRLTALRTAASSAVSIRHLARKDAAVLGLLGAGGQSEFQVRAACEQRAFDTLLIAARSESGANRLAEKVKDLPLKIETVGAQAMARRADVIITVTPSFSPILMDDWIRPGVHIAAMGADTLGKQELDQKIVERADLFTDEIAQSTSIGEFQHAYRNGAIGLDDITPIGAVINGRSPGRRNSDDITLFDGTGVGLQDLAAAHLALRSVPC